jgi:anti-sigma B factor antagonist
VAALDTESRISSGLRISESDVDGVRVLSASGELDLAAAPAFCASVDGARSEGHRRLLLDLTALEFCDSSGLRALRGAAEEIVASAGRVVVVPPEDGPVARLVELVGASEFLPVHADVDAGLTALGPPAARSVR